MKEPISPRREPIVDSEFPFVLKTRTGNGLRCEIKTMDFCNPDIALPPAIRGPLEVEFTAKIHGDVAIPDLIRCRCGRQFIPVDGGMTCDNGNCGNFLRLIDKEEYCTT